MPENYLHNKQMRTRAFRALLRSGVLNRRRNYDDGSISWEVDTRKLQSITANDIIRMRNCGIKTLPLCMETIEKLKQIFL